MCEVGKTVKDNSIPTSLIKRRQLGERGLSVSLCAQSMAKVPLRIHVLLYTSKSACICHISEESSAGAYVFLTTAASKAHETEL